MRLVGRIILLVLLLGVLLENSVLPASALASASGESEEDLAGFEGFTPKVQRTKWTPVFTSGFDALLHSYPLATTDTTETITEYFVSAGVEGRSPRQGKHRWRLRAEASAGSELYRQHFEGQYQLRDDQKVTRLRIDSRFYGRQYRNTTDYSLSSDNMEGRLDLRAYPWAGPKSKLEFRGWGSSVNYQKNSSLEVDSNELGGGVFLRSRGLTNNFWSAGYRYSARSYPDSTGINRNIHRLEGDFDFHDDQGQGLSLFQKSGRRLIEDESLRPSAWTHWTDFSGLVAAGDGFVFLDLQSEIWKYNEETEVYFDSWRLNTSLGYRWGDILNPNWRLGLASERLNAGDSPETYTQVGLHFGVESFGSDISGSIMVEFGRRVYSQDTSETEESVSDIVYVDEFSSFYSDFNYWKIWVMANWVLNPNFSLDLMANYEPENHTENTEDSSLGFGSIRLVWRP